MTRLISREDLSPLRDAASAFIIVTLWDRLSGDEVNEGAALKTLEALRHEINKFAKMLQERQEAFYAKRAS